MPGISGVSLKPGGGGMNWKATLGLLSFFIFISDILNQ
jgi:hypothetical protein|tara:strand:+ start:325 stop:438 length:114 start_codon:yes stop_codon:yes gene_type:complete